MSSAATKSGSGSLLELVLIIATALGLALAIQALLVKPYRIPSESMEPTLNVGQRVLVNRIGNRFTRPEVGDITVFHPPAGAERDQCGDRQERPENAAACSRPTPQRSNTNFIKRVVGLPGDRISIQDGDVIRNGRRMREPYAQPCEGSSECNLPREITVPPGHYFMMGDNREHSADSRIWGPVPRRWIIGGAFATYWPPGRVGPL